VKVVCISDTHMRHDIEIPEGDVLIHCGDFAITRDSMADLKVFAEWFQALPHKHKILVPGNHDWAFERDEENARKLLPDVTVLIDEAIEIDGVKFYGTPVQPVFYHWAFNTSRHKREMAFSRIPEDTTILITHSPPYGILDEVRGENVGCPALKQRVDTIKPKYHVFGHIHPSYGVIEEDGTTFINASLLDDSYTLVNEPIVFIAEGAT